MKIEEAKQRLMGVRDAYSPADTLHQALDIALWSIEHQYRLAAVVAATTRGDWQEAVASLATWRHQNPMPGETK